MSGEKDVIHLALQETVSELTGYQKYLEELKEKNLYVIEIALREAINMEIMATMNTRETQYGSNFDLDFKWEFNTERKIFQAQVKVIDCEIWYEAYMKAKKDFEKTAHFEKGEFDLEFAEEVCDLDEELPYQTVNFEIPYYVVCDLIFYNAGYYNMITGEIDLPF